MSHLKQLDQLRKFQAWNWINDNVTANSILVGASNGMPAVVGNGPVKVREWDDGPIGATMYQMDVFRQAVAPVHLNSSSLNMSIYQVTAVTT